jgi:hypothetical protein
VLLRWAFRVDRVNGDFPPPPVPAENVTQPIPVVARIVWTKEGEEHIACDAIRWTRTHVLVDLSRDRRCSTIGVWLPATDVKRR